MSDIFISYSRKDSEQAEELIELLASAGLSCWIDTQGIAGAENWGTEIVEGIRACSTFMVLISSNSVRSENVLRELSLASEKRKRVLPVDLEPTLLPSSFEYPLAGLQRVAITDFDKILHAHKYGVEKVIRKDERKSLMILPFEDLSPTGDNGWFADGIVSELISALSNVKSIRIADNQATKEFKKYNGLLTTYAREMNYRYFVQGDVRKFGDSIKITSRLLDIETGDHLWQDSMKGTMNDIFDIQEKVAEMMVEALKIHLAPEERKKLAERETENSEAYELVLKAREYTDRNTKEGLTYGLELLQEALRLDPNYAVAYRFQAHAELMIYRSYDRDVQRLEQARRLLDRAIELAPTLWRVYEDRSLIYMYQGKLQEAEEAAMEFIHYSPDDYSSHFALGFFYMETNQPEKAIPPFEAAVRIKPDHIRSLFNLCLVCGNSKQIDRRTLWAQNAAPYYARHLRMHPDDDSARVFYGGLLMWAGRWDEAVETATYFSSKPDPDPYTQYNLACLYGALSNYTDALANLRRSVERGYAQFKQVEGWGTNDWIVGNPAYQAQFAEILALSKSKLENSQQQHA
jgi:TolB-like protein/Tfp pilus assembly protein PilF